MSFKVSTDAHGSKARKNPNKSILTQRQTGAIKIIYEGQDLTPEPLNPLAYEGVRERQISVYDMTGPAVHRNASTETASKVFSQSTSRFHSELHRQTLLSGSVFKSYISTDAGCEFEIEPAKKESLSSSLFDEDIEFPCLGPDEQYGLRKVPTRISLVLTETETAFLFEMPSKTVDKNSEEATAVEEENERYLYLTQGKGRNRKVVHAEAQTNTILLKSRTTEAGRVTRRHNHAFASNYDLYDTLEQGTVTEDLENQEFLDEGPTIVEKSRLSVENILHSYEEVQMAALLKNAKFLDVLCIMERLLANNNFNAQQKRFRGIDEPDPFRTDIEYKYKLNLLWTFANKDTVEQCVTSICWNDANTDILAVSYGKFFYTDRKNGMVLIWNIKNPVQPERVYRFEAPVTAVDFSKANPNLLAIGFYDGSVKVIDVSNRGIQIIGQTSKDASYEPIWQVMWCQGNDYFKGEELIFATCQDGRVNQYRIQVSIILGYSQMIRIARPEGTLKGIETMRRCHVPGIPIGRYTSALVLQIHPTDPDIYYVGTSEGTIHKCSRNHFHQHLDLFLGHNGPLYAMKFSPFCNKLFLTCGDDWNVRVWAEGVTEPIFELIKTMSSVQGADWSPIHSTIIASICGPNILIWDLQRKTYAPQSETLSPTNSRNTVVQFTKSGRCLVVGDIDGNVHIFSLEDMPFPAFFQDDLLITAIKRGLITRPDLINRLKKLGSFSFETNKS